MVQPPADGERTDASKSTVVQASASETTSASASASASAPAPASTLVGHIAHCTGESQAPAPVSSGTTTRRLHTQVAEDPASAATAAPAVATVDVVAPACGCGE